MYYKIAAWLDGILENGVPADVAAFYFCLEEDEDIEGNWTLDMVGTRNFENDSCWPEDIVTDFDTILDNPFTFVTDTERPYLLDEIKSILEEYLNSGNYGAVLRGKAGVAIGYEELANVTIIYRNSDYKVKFDYKLFFRKLLAWLILFGIGAALSINGALELFVWEEGTTVKQYDWGGEMIIRHSHKNGGIFLVLGIFIVCISFGFILKGIAVQIIFGLGMMAIGFGIPVFYIMQNGLEGISTLLLVFFGIIGLYMVFTNILRIVGRNSTAEKMDKKIGNMTWNWIKGFRK